MDPVENPLFAGSCLGNLFFANFNKIITAGCSKTYTEDMLYPLDKEMLHDDFEAFYKFYLKKKDAYKDDFLGLLFEYNKKWQRIGSIIFNCRYITEISFPYFVKEILNWLEKDSKDF